MRFKQKYSLEERKEKAQKQLSQDPDKILIIAEKNPKSKLPDVNPKFLCEGHYQFNMIKTMLASKISQKLGKKITATQSLFVFIGKNVPNGDETMKTIYDKYKDQDGFLYLQYQDMQVYG